MLADSPLRTQADEITSETSLNRLYFRKYCITFLTSSFKISRIKIQYLSFEMDQKYYGMGPIPRRH